MYSAATAFGKDTQVISQPCSNQIIRDKGSEKSVKTYFNEVALEILAGTMD